MLGNEHTRSIRWTKWLNEFEYCISALALLGLAGMLTISILARYVGGISIPWSEEISRFIFITLIFSSISYAARQHRHIRITMFVDKVFSKRIGKIIYTAGDLVWLGFNAAVLYGAYVIISDMFRYPFSSPVLNIPMYYIYAIIPLFFLTLSLRIIQGIIVRLRGEDIDLQRMDQV